MQHNRPFVETRFIASLPKDMLQSLIELVLGDACGKPFGVSCALQNQEDQYESMVKQTEFSKE